MYLIQKICDADHGDRDDISGELDTTHVDIDRVGQGHDAISSCEGSRVQGLVDNSTSGGVKDNVISLDWGVAGGHICSNRRERIASGVCRENVAKRKRSNNKKTGQISPRPENLLCGTVCSVSMGKRIISNAGRKEGRRGRPRSFRQTKKMATLREQFVPSTHGRALSTNIKTSTN